MGGSGNTDDTKTLNYTYTYPFLFARVEKLILEKYFSLKYSLFLAQKFIFFFLFYFILRDKTFM